MSSFTLADVPASLPHVQQTARITPGGLSLVRAVVVGLGLACSGLALAQVSPDLGTAAPFVVLGTNGVATSGTVS